MKKTLLLSAFVLMVGFGVWSLYAGSRYQALCELSYWSASAEELKLCDERAVELGGK
ncbi:hypothetical protein WOC76_10205 [Methylocystis sp. IM3]|jgi:hypothetical protein|uniref:hypothetical protein n=1 Tax=unclassified Methylocystis TaxID=2625913 RepID=UPI0026851EE9